MYKEKSRHKWFTPTNSIKHWSLFQECKFSLFCEWKVSNSLCEQNTGGEKPKSSKFFKNHLIKLFNDKNSLANCEKYVLNLIKDIHRKKYIKTHLKVKYQKFPMWEKKTRMLPFYLALVRCVLTSAAKARKLNI